MDSLFSLTRHGEVLAAVPLTRGPQDRGVSLTVSELQFYGFEVQEREPDTEYMVLLGDIRAGTADRGEGGLGRAMGRIVVWEDDCHFESARGPVQVRVLARRLGSGEPWVPHGELTVNVVPSKLSEARYRAMFDQLSALSAGLVFDLVSKARRGVRHVLARGEIATRSSQLELGLIDHVWQGTGAALRQVAQEPVTGLNQVREVRACWGGERLGARTLRDLVARGIDPRRSRPPFPAVTERLREGLDTPEHRVILWFLRLLKARLRECARAIEAHVRSIQAERLWRDIAVEDGPTLWHAVDVPRIERLDAAGRRAMRIERQIQAAERLPLLRGLVPQAGIPGGPVFDHVGPYFRLGQEMRRFLASSIAMLDTGADERVKATSRMYEQWVFLQITAALRKAGLRCEGIRRLVRRTSAHRFTMDLQRDTRVRLVAGGGWEVRVRYEPLIFPEALARARGDTVYRGRAGETPWCPDVLVEFVRQILPGTPPRVEYAIVVDAKYAVRVEDRHWRQTDKYLQIRAIDGSRQIVKQVWIAFPGAGTEIVCRDPAVAWTTRGPDRPTDETLQGVLAVSPPEASGASEPDLLVRPHPTLVAFASGLLAYLKVEVLPDGDRPAP